MRIFKFFFRSVLYLGVGIAFLISFALVYLFLLAADEPTENPS